MSTSLRSIEIFEMESGNIKNHKNVLESDQIGVFLVWVSAVRLGRGPSIFFLLFCLHLFFFFLTSVPLCLAHFSSPTPPCCRHLRTVVIVSAYRENPLNAFSFLLSRFAWAGWECTWHFWLYKCFGRAHEENRVVLVAVLQRMMQLSFYFPTAEPLPPWGCLLSLSLSPPALFTCHNCLFVFYQKLYSFYFGNMARCLWCKMEAGLYKLRATCNFSKDV